MKIIIPLIVLLLLISAWLLPSITPALGIGLLVISLGMAIFAILKKHSAPYRQGKITQSTLIRRIGLDIFGILFAVALAVLLGGYVAGLLTRSINDDPWRLVAMILIGLLVGMGVGIFVNRAWGRLTKISSS